MEITKDIKAKVFGCYLGVEVDIANTQWHKKEAKSRNRFTKATLSGVNLHEDIVGGCIKHNIETQNNGFMWLDFDVFKLILKPITKITDDDVIKLGEMLSGTIFKKVYREGDKVFLYHCISKTKFKYPIGEYVMIHKNAIVYHDGDGYDNEVTTPDSSTYQFLQSMGYDLPHYLLGRKTLQEAGLAIYK